MSFSDLSVRLIPWYKCFSFGQFTSMTCIAFTTRAVLRIFLSQLAGIFLTYSQNINVWEFLVISGVLIYLIKIMRYVLHRRKWDVTPEFLFPTSFETKKLKFLCTRKFKRKWMLYELKWVGCTQMHRKSMEVFCAPYRCSVWAPWVSIICLK